MISIREQSYGLNVALYNEFTLDNFRQLESALLESKQKIHLSRHTLRFVHAERLHHRYGGRTNKNSSINTKTILAGLPSLQTTSGSNSARASPAS